MTRHSERVPSVEPSMSQTLSALWWACVLALVVLVVGCLLHLGNAP